MREGEPKRCTCIARANAYPRRVSLGWGAQGLYECPLCNFGIKENSENTY